MTTKKLTKLLALYLPYLLLGLAATNFGEAWRLADDMFPLIRGGADEQYIPQSLGRGIAGRIVPASGSAQGFITFHAFITAF